MECDGGNDSVMRQTMEKMRKCKRPKGYTGHSEMPQLSVYFACMQKKEHPLTQGWCRNGQMHGRLWRFTAKTAYTIIS